MITVLEPHIKFFHMCSLPLGLNASVLDGGISVTGYRQMLAGYYTRTSILVQCTDLTLED